MAERPSVAVALNLPKSMFALNQPVFVMLSLYRVILSVLISFWLFLSFSFLPLKVGVVCTGSLGDELDINICCPELAD